MNAVLRALGRFVKKNGPKAGKAAWKFQVFVTRQSWKMSTGLASQLGPKPTKKKKR